MSNRRKTNDIASMQFYKLDKWLLMEEGLKKLSPTAKMLYVIIKDREELSLKNAKAFTDKDGYLFQYFDQQKASDLLGVSLTAIKKAFKDLVEYKLIESVRQGLGKPNRLYVLDYEITQDTINKLSYESKKAPSAPTDEALKSNNFQNDLSNNSIPQSKENYTENDKKNKESNASKILDIINGSCVNIKKVDLGKCEEEFTDTDRLKIALEVCENNNSNGIKALRLAYKNAYNSNNNCSKGAGHGVNDNFKKYAPDDLEKMLQESQRDKFKDIDNSIKEFTPNFPM